MLLVRREIRYTVCPAVSLCNCLKQLTGFHETWPKHYCSYRMLRLYYIFKIPSWMAAARTSEVGAWRHIVHTLHWFIQHTTGMTHLKKNDYHHVMQGVVVELRKIYSVFKGIYTRTTWSRDMAAVRILYFVCGFKTVTSEPLELGMWSAAGW
jgi:hypothetical protein